jgi:hypothetical protein
VAFAYAGVATGAIATGAAGLAGAALLWITAPAPNPRGARLTLQPVVGEGRWSIELRGAW